MSGTNSATPLNTNHPPGFDILVIDLSADKEFTQAQQAHDPATFTITVDGVTETIKSDTVGARHYHGDGKPGDAGNNSGSPTGGDAVVRIKIPTNMVGGLDEHHVTISFTDAAGGGAQTNSEHLYIDNLTINGVSQVSNFTTSGQTSGQTGQGTNGPIGKSVELEGQNSSVTYTTCYLRGTRIATPDGDVAVEALTIGQMVTTPDGVAPIKWIGHRAYDDRFSHGNAALLPVLVRAGALSDGIPSRDLYLSPKHALLIDGVLVPAETLINGTSITKVTEMAAVEYFHVELAQHGVVFAEGAAAESFVDDSSRGVFHNAREYADLYPNEQRGEPVYCAPRHEDGEIVESIRRKIALRADPTAEDDSGFGALLGRVGSVADGVVRGWAQHAGKPEVPVCLELMSGDTVVTRTLANRFRADLWKAGVGSGCQAFEVAVPAHVDASSLRVRRATDGAELAVAARKLESLAA